MNRIMHDRSTQTSEQDFYSDSYSESDTDSDTETYNWVDELLGEDIVDIESSIQEYVYEWTKSNPAFLSSSHVERLVSTDIAIEIFDEFLNADLCDDTDANYQFVFEWTKQVVLGMNIRNAPPWTGDTPTSLANRLQRLNDAPNPEQRTQAWYDSRYNLLTASNLWKALGTDAQKNSLIYEKCKPYEQFVEECSRHGNLSADNAMSWGQKYEPVSLQLYEQRTQTRVNPYGCIVHKEHGFLGASPDGIVSSENGEGKMIEIKNIVNREITGVPLDHYWIQMQIQMEVCDLDECDFVETRFKEFADEAAYMESDIADKGVILRFAQRRTLDDLINPSKANLDPFYEYSPLGIQDIDSWTQEYREKYAPAYVLVNTVYWYLDQYSCVLVKRNRDWFQAVLPKVRDAWDTIQRERVEGYEHRAPSRRKNPVSKNMESGGYTINMPVLGGGLCLVKLEA
jgi:putative phage-type endonuclease